MTRLSWSRRDAEYLGKRLDRIFGPNYEWHDDPLRRKIVIEVAGTVRLDMLEDLRDVLRAAPADVTCVAVPRQMKFKDDDEGYLAQTFPETTLIQVLNIDFITPPGGGPQMGVTFDLSQIAWDCCGYHCWATSYVSKCPKCGKARP